MRTRHPIHVFALALAATSALCITPVRAQSGVAATAPPTGLGEWRPMANGGSMMRLVGDPGKPEWFAFRVRYSPDVTNGLAPHFHLGTEHVTVLSGTLMLGFGDRVDSSKAVAHGPGSFVVIEAGAHHFEWFRGELLLHVEGFGPMRTVVVDRPAPGQQRNGASGPPFQ